MSVRKWEKLEPRPRHRIYGEPFISILKSGKISINKAATEKYLRDVRFVELFLERETKLLGIRPVAGGEIFSAFKLAHNKKWGSSMISARSILQELGILKDQTIRYPAYWDAEEGMLIVELGKPLHSERKELSDKLDVTNVEKR